MSKIDMNTISDQISVCRTDTTLIELVNKLNCAPVQVYSHIHA